MNEKIEFKLPPSPPDEIFKNRLNRQNPSISQWGDQDNGTVTFIPERFEYIRKTEDGYLQIISRGGEEKPERIVLTEEEFKNKGLKLGNFVYYYGIPDIPSKTIAPVEAIYAINPIKRRLIDTINLLSSKEMILPFIGFVLIGRKAQTRLLNKALYYFNEEANITAAQWYLNDYYCDVVREIQNFGRVFLTEIGIDEVIASGSAERIGMLFEYDNAYRYPVNDALNETSKERLLNNFPKEVMRLVNLITERGNFGKTNYVPDKFKKAAKLLKYAWYIPRFRRAIKKGIEAMNFDNCKLSWADIFHTLLYATYNVGGKSVEERTQIYMSLYPKDQPPRVLIRNQL